MRGRRDRPPARQPFAVPPPALREGDGRLLGGAHASWEIAEERLSESALDRYRELLETLLALHETSDRVSVEELRDFALDEMVRLTRSAVGYLHLYEEETGRLTPLGWSRELRRRCGSVDLPVFCELGESGCWGEAVRRRRTLITDDPAGMQPGGCVPPGGQLPMDRLISVPIFNEGRIVAVVGAGDKRDPYDDRDELQLTLLGRAFWEIFQRRRREEEALAYQRSMRWLVRRLEVAEEEERRRIAGELHDTIAQDLAAARLRVGGLRDAAPEGELRSGLAEVDATLAAAIGYSRALTYELSSPLLHQFGIEAALPKLAEQFASRHGLTIRCECAARPTGLPEDLAVLLYGVARELLRNVVKHAQARQAVLRLQGGDGAVRLEVEDDGRGLPAGEPRSGASERGGFGLFSIRERLREIGGSMRVETGSGRGTRMIVEAPRPGPSWERRS